MLDRPQHPFPRQGPGASYAGKANLPALYVRRNNTSLTKVYLGDRRGSGRIVSRLKWIISTCIIGAAGLAVIGVVMYASMNIEDGSGMMASIRREGLKALKPKESGIKVDEDAATLGVKTDKIVITSSGLTTKHIIHDSVVQRRGTREFIQIKPYVRIVATLATTKPAGADRIPPLNPLELYSNENAPAAKEKQVAVTTGPVFDPRIETKLIDLAGGFLPQEDEQELSITDVERYVAEADAAYTESEANLRLAAGDAGTETAVAEVEAQDAVVAAPPTIVHTRGLTIAAKSPDDVESEEDVTTRTITARSSDTLQTLIKSIGTEPFQANIITEAFNQALGGAKIRPGYELRYSMLGGQTDLSAAKEPVKLSLFSGGTHLGTIRRNAAGEYTPDDTPVELPERADEVASNYPQRSTAYLSTYQAAASEGLPTSLINRFLRIHSYDVDYKFRVQTGDSFELFYDINTDDNGVERPGELLYASFTIGGITQGYYRFRTPDGATDYYDEKGSNSKKFLMRTPIKAGRFTSGYGLRRHPLLGIMKMHTGVDWGHSRTERRIIMTKRARTRRNS